MSHVLFIVHGMGDHLPTWSHEHVALLNELLSGYAVAKGSTTPFTDRVNVEEITYDAVFDHHVLAWGQRVEALAQFGKEHGIALPRTLTLLSGHSLSVDAKQFVWETLLDPVLYRGARVVRNDVRAIVAAQVLEKWDWYLSRPNRGTAPVNVSFLCHSLGTIVTSDVLAHIGEARDKASKPFSAAKQSIHVLCTLANVTQLGPPGLIDIDSTRTVVRPTSAPKVKGFPRNYLSHYVNARNEYDPFCWWQRFAPTGWGAGYVDVDVDHLRVAFPHDYLHYLRHPKVHIAFFRALFGSRSITVAEETAAVNAFKRVALPTACDSAVTTLEHELKALAKAGSTAGGTASGLDEVVANAVRAYEAAKAAVDACSQLEFGGPP
jgi:hypothetical protein